MKPTLRPVLSLLLVVAATASPGYAGGPMVLMGIDAEDFGPGGHGPVETYAEVLSEMLADSGSPGSGVLVIGGGKDPADDVTRFWKQVGGEVGIAVDFVNGPSDIAALTDLSRYKLVAVASSFHETPFGGLTDLENLELARQASLISGFVNDDDGALFSSSQTGLRDPYGYLGGVAAIESSFPAAYDDITPTAAGRASGITDDLDVCCWHDEYVRYPSFLGVLATNASSGKAAALGGEDVRIENSDNCTVPRFGPVPIPKFVQLCTCIRDDTLRSFGCRFIDPDFLFVRRIPWPLVPGREFTVRYELTAFADLEGLTFHEGLPEEFSMRQGLPTSVEFDPLSAGQSTTLSLGFMAPAQIGEFEGQGTLVAADGSEHHSRLSYEVADEPAPPGADDESRPGARPAPWWWLVTLALVLAAWLLASRRKSSSHGQA